jgi:hypothetical protein
MPPRGCGGSAAAAVERRSALSFPHEPLSRSTDQSHCLWKQDAHGVAKADRLLVRPTVDADLLQRRGGQLDGGVQGQRRELLALGLLDAFGLLLGELAQAAHQVFGVAAEGESFHAARLAKRLLIAALDVTDELFDSTGGAVDRLGDLRPGLLAKLVEQVRACHPQRIGLDAGRFLRHLA